MRTHLQRIGSLLAGLGRSGGSGPRIFACSLAAGLTLGASSLFCLEALDERREEAYRGGASDTAGDTAGHDTRAEARTESPGTEPAESGRVLKTRGGEPAREDERSGPGPESAGQESGQPEARELEARLREITSGYPGEYGVVLWQPESGTRVSVGAGESFSAASLAKLPVLLALYREASEGHLSLDERIETRPADIQSYGTGVLHTYPVGTGMRLRDCAEYLIKESDNTAWRMLERRLGRDRVRQEIDSVGARSSHYADARHTTSPDDTLKVLRKISDPAYTSPEHSREMLSTMTSTAFEDRLPQGLPADARIHHKIGSLGDSFGDAGMVVPPEDEGSGGPYYIVVLSKDAGGEAVARGAMREISLAAYRGLVDPEARPRSAWVASERREEQTRGDQPA